MILGYLDQSGNGHNPTTVTDARQSINIFTIIENCEYESIPEEWIEAYKCRILLDGLSNGHYEMDIPFKNIRRIEKLITHTQSYIPDKCNIVTNSTLTKEDIINMDCDYIIFEDGSKLVSNRVNNPRLPVYEKDSRIHFKKAGKTSSLDPVNGTIFTSIKFTGSFDADDIICSNFRGTMVRSWTKTWDVYNLAQLITLHPQLSQVCCINESNRLLDTSSFLLMVAGFVKDIHAYIRYMSGIVTINISLCGCDQEYDLMAKLVHSILDMYDATEEEIDMYTDKQLSLLRSYDPNLFIKNYSRICAILPIPGKSDHSIEYPLGSNRYYGAPEGLYPGLKVNTLSNKNKYPYIVTCYKRNHINLPNKITFRYYNDLDIQKRSKYVSLKDCLREFTPVSDPDISIVLQELYNIDISCNIDVLESMYSNKMYRYYEELYDINILLVHDNNVIIPDCPKPYFWNYNPNRDTITINVAHHKYKIIKTDSKYLKQKLEKTIRYPKIQADAQYVDHYGKRRMIMVNNQWIDSVGAPLNIPCKDCINPYIECVRNITYAFFEDVGKELQEPTGSTRHYAIYPSF
jgi:Family of unknown function (DUF5757)